MPADRVFKTRYRRGQPSNTGHESEDNSSAVGYDAGRGGEGGVEELRNVRFIIMSLIHT